MLCLSFSNVVLKASNNCESFLFWHLLLRQISRIWTESLFFSLCMTRFNLITHGPNHMLCHVLPLKVPALHFQKECWKYHQWWIGSQGRHWSNLTCWFHMFPFNFGVGYLNILIEDYLFLIVSPNNDFICWFKLIPINLSPLNICWSPNTEKNRQINFTTLQVLNYLTQSHDICVSAS